MAEGPESELGALRRNVFRISRDPDVRMGINSDNPDLKKRSFAWLHYLDSYGREQFSRDLADAEKVVAYIGPNERRVIYNRRLIHPNET